MDSYIDKFREIVLKHLKRRAKDEKAAVQSLFLGFYFGKVENSETHQQEGYGVGYIDGKHQFVPNYIIEGNIDAEKYFIQCVDDDYEWTFYPKLASSFPDEAAADSVIKLLSLENASIACVGDTRDFTAWQQEGEKFERTQDELFVYQGYPSMSDILNVLVDFLHIEEALPPLIHKSLELFCERYEIDPMDIRAYIIPDKSGTDISVHIYNVASYVCNSSLEEIVTSAMMTGE